jgi:acetyl-CoA/propionyl-CoA carboxylase biotin carboxyl carrier protein
LPATGPVLAYEEPRLRGVRVDSGVRAGSRVGSDYDSLVAKVIAHGPDRTTALDRLATALRRFSLLGVMTNTGFLASLVDAEPVRGGDLDTGLIERVGAAFEPAPSAMRAAASVVSVVKALRIAGAATSGDPWDTLVGWRLEGPAPIVLRLIPAGAKEPLSVAVTLIGADAVRVRLGDVETQMNARRLGLGRVAIELDGRRSVWRHAAHGDRHWVSAGAQSFAFTLLQPAIEGSDAAAEGALEAPMPGLVRAVRAQEGAAVAEGEVLVVIESMKMELSVTAPSAATVSAIHVSEGQSVRQGQTVVDLDVQ